MTETHTEAEHAPTPRSYTFTLAWLFVLLGLTVAVNELPFARVALAIAMLIASIKAGLVLYTFMELRGASASTRATAAVCLFTVGLLFGLSAIDWTVRDQRLVDRAIPRAIATP